MKDLVAYRKKLENKIAQKKSRFTFAEKTSRDALARAKRGIVTRRHNKAMTEGEK